MGQHVVALGLARHLDDVGAGHEVEQHGHALGARDGDDEVLARWQRHGGGSQAGLHVPLAEGVQVQAHLFGLGRQGIEPVSSLLIHDECPLGLEGG